MDWKYWNPPMFPVQLQYALRPLEQGLHKWSSLQTSLWLGLRSVLNTGKLIHTYIIIPCHFSFPSQYKLTVQLTQMTELTQYNDIIKYVYRAVFLTFEIINYRLRRSRNVRTLWRWTAVWMSTLSSALINASALWSAAIIAPNLAKKFVMKEIVKLWWVFHRISRRKQYVWGGHVRIE